MMGVLVRDSALVRPCWAWDNHAPGARWTARPIDQQSSSLPLYFGCPQRDDAHIL